MKNEKTVDQVLSEKDIGRPNPLIYGVLKIVARTVLNWQYHPKVYWKTNFSKVKGPYILISNHASRADYVFNSAFLKERVNHVLGYNEFFRSHLSGTVNSVNCIPKKNFVFEVKPIHHPPACERKRSRAYSTFSTLDPATFSFRIR